MTERMDNKDTPQPKVGEVQTQKLELKVSDAIQIAKSKQSQKEGGGVFYPGLTSEEEIVHKLAEVFPESANGTGTSEETISIPKLVAIKEEDRTPEQRKILVDIINPDAPPSDIAAAFLAIKAEPEAIQHWMSERGNTDEEIEQVMQQRAVQILDEADPQRYSEDEILDAAKTLSTSRERMNEYVQRMREIAQRRQDEQEKTEINAKADRIEERVKQHEDEFATDEQLAQQQKEDEEQEPAVPAPAGMDEAISEAKEFADQMKQMEKELDTLPKDQAAALAEKGEGIMDKLLNPEFSRRLAWKIPIFSLLTLLVLYIYALHIATGWAKKR